MAHSSVLNLTAFGLLLCRCLTLASALPEDCASTYQHTEPYQRLYQNLDALNGSNFPDPCIIEVDNKNYLFSTNDKLSPTPLRVPMTSSPDFNDPSSWSERTDAFPETNVPAFGSNGWASPGSIWAPSVLQMDNDFIMYYAAALQSNPPSSNIHCIGVARSPNVTGPYNDTSLEPWICPESQGGAVDVAGFLDPCSGNRYIVYKVDGPMINNGGHCASNATRPILFPLAQQNTSLMLQQTGSDGHTLIGPAVQLWDQMGEDDRWQVEGPSIRYSEDGTHFLFFSSGCYNDNSYTVSYVTSVDGIAGPYGDRQILLRTCELEILDCMGRVEWILRWMQFWAMLGTESLGLHKRRMSKAGSLPATTIASSTFRSFTASCNRTNYQKKGSRTGKLQKIPTKPAATDAEVLKDIRCPINTKSLEYLRYPTFIKKLQRENPGAVLTEEQAGRALATFITRGMPKSDELFVLSILQGKKKTGPSRNEEFRHVKRLQVEAEKYWAQRGEKDEGQSDDQSVTANMQSLRYAVHATGRPSAVPVPSCRSFALSSAYGLPQKPRAKRGVSKTPATKTENADLMRGIHCPEIPGKGLEYVTFSTFMKKLQKDHPGVNFTKEQVDLLLAKFVTKAVPAAFAGHVQSVLQGKKPRKNPGRKSEMQHVPRLQAESERYWNQRDKDDRGRSDHQ
ncbi:uncharacterized protein MYCGRDRAFT_96947 [Zymoseptoria tritici IPO323]|uniref:Uncharacterized protein n=1 Tax=Zymoseptoria tritici (strain CBS 115943 / IPO323) TaxID=336722 RepID=F9XNE6_ZYMTI|nr:uncharacterized protein MYCGRDRAFT_96947 [Zymoseptoria tritici IPO323]EGP82856.1 hypothetical protein MYCGRDRAFT_96947 [Zymoseptoria tritici IPO323]